MKTGRFIVLSKDSENKETKLYIEIKIISVTNNFIHLKFISSNYERWLTKKDFDREFSIEEDITDIANSNDFYFGNLLKKIL